MVRPIKFRAWDKEDFKIRKVLAMSFEHDTISVKVNDEEYLQDDTSRFEIMQFTGLLDKNGAEIYEGDIMAIMFPKGPSKITKLEIVYQNGGFKRKWLSDHAIRLRGHKIEPLKGEQIKSLEIIGNIYEHSELLGDNS